MKIIIIIFLLLLLYYFGCMSIYIVWKYKKTMEDLLYAMG
jgi:hypothetical protein